MDNRTIEQVRENEDRLIKKLQQKENIIKEVREYIEKKWKEDSYWEDIDNCLKFCEFNEYEYEDILKLLDKGE